MMEYEELLKKRIEMKAGSLKESAVMLRDDMNKLIRKLEAGHLNGVNGLGEVQSMGVSIDRECAELRLMLCSLSEFVTWYESKNKEEI